MLDANIFAWYNIKQLILFITMYDLPQFNFGGFKKTIRTMINNKVFQAAILILVIIVAVGFSNWKKNLLTCQFGVSYVEPL